MAWILPRLIWMRQPPTHVMRWRQWRGRQFRKTWDFENTNKAAEDAVGVRGGWTPQPPKCRGCCGRGTKRHKKSGKCVGKKKRRKSRRGRRRRRRR